MEVEEEPNQSQEAKVAELVEENCEYLVHLYNLCSIRNLSLSNTLKTIEAYIEGMGEEVRAKPNYEDILQLFIQLCYFLYACKMFGKSLVFNWQDIKVEQIPSKGEKKFKVVIFYKVEDQSMEDGQGYELFQNILEHIDKHLKRYYQDVEVPTDSKTELEYLQTYKKFQKQMEALSGSGLQENQSALFGAIEQTDLFYLHSLLYRIKNCSILDVIRANSNNLALFKEARKRDLQLFGEFSQEKKKLKGSQEILRQKEKEIDSNILDFFKKMETANFKEINDQNSRINFVCLIKEKSNKPFDEVIGVESTQNTDKTNLELKRPKAELQYTVQCSSEKNSITVRLLMPNIIVNADTSDFLMYQSNVLTFDSTSVSIELKEMEAEKEQREKEKEMAVERQYPPLSRYVAFKCTSSFNVKQPILEKVLAMMDITMIASRLYQVEMNPQNYFQGAIKDIYQRTSIIAKKIQHYTKFFSRCSKRVYRAE